MPTVRPFTPDDVPAVAALRRRVFRVTRRAAPGELERYVHEVFFGGPFRDPELTGLVAEEGGEVSGFVGLIPRPMRQGGRAVRAAVCTQLMVDPARRGVAGVLLVRGILNGPQDLLYADVANVPARRLWERLGGSTAEAYAFTWTLPLRPARHAAARLGGGAAARAARGALRPLLWAADALLARSHPRHDGRNGEAPASGEVARVSDPSELCEAVPLLASTRALHPAYEPESLAYLLERARQRWPGEGLHLLVLRGPDGKTAGCAAYVDGAGGTARVLLVAAAEGRRAELLRHLADHARARGAVALQGRLEPGFVPALDDAGCAWHRQGQGILAHARDPALLATVLRGDALLSGLDGEWWLDF